MLEASKSLYERVASARVPVELIDGAIEQAIAGLPAAHMRSHMRSLLHEGQHGEVIRKEAVDVVILVTSAMEHPDEEVYQDLIGLVDPAPFDVATGQLKVALMQHLSEDAMEEVPPETQEAVRMLLYRGLQACGWEGDLPASQLAL